MFVNGGGDKLSAIRVVWHDACGAVLCCVLQEVGNRMTEQNLAMIMGPNILHKDVKVRNGAVVRHFRAWERTGRGGEQAGGSASTT